MTRTARTLNRPGGDVGWSGGPTTRRVAIVGGGIIGLSCAWRLLRARCEVVVLDPDPAGGATHAAAGMLAPASEAVFGQESLLGAGLASARLWPQFAAQLSADSRTPVHLASHGTLVVAADADDEGLLARHARLLERQHVKVERLTSRIARRLEPALSPRLCGGLLLDDEAAVDPRQVCQALLTAISRLGGRVVRSVGDPAALLDDAEFVVVAGGWQTSALVAELGVSLPVRPLKGQILRLRAAPDTLRRTVRATVHGREVYLVPRPGGEVVVGATSEDVGAQTRTTAGGVHDLLHDAIEVVPELAEGELVESTARLRPSTPDNLPLIGPVGPAGLLVATGHGRDGILLAPLTAEVIAGHVLGRTLPAAASSLAAQRLSLTEEPA